MYQRDLEANEDKKYVPHKWFGPAMTTGFEGTQVWMNDSGFSMWYASGDAILGCANQFEVAIKPQNLAMGQHAQLPKLTRTLNQMKAIAQNVAKLLHALLGRNRHV